ncbi:hypothetical protein GTW37_02580 [Streptomyces sp. SID4931]|nr:hypothetical protein [Streptomyces sp. SID4931]SCF64849.1 hypothetical protein GA0115255_101324 [Streptomyces sp. Ncost-T6T-2b]
MLFSTRMRRIAVAALTSLALLGWGAQATATAAERNGDGAWNLSETMPQDMRDFVTTYYPDGPPQDIRARGSIGEACTGKLYQGIPLPIGVNPSVRKATLFTYWNASTGTSCALMDNNTGGAKYMVLQLCANSFPSGTNQPCITDTGNFSQYAGEVKLYATDHAGICDPVWAYMRDSAGKVLVNYRTNVGGCH